MSNIHIHRLSEIATIVTGSTPRTENEQFWNGSIPFYSPADFDGKVFCELTEKKVSELGAKFGRMIPAGSIMVTCIGSIGKIAISSIPGITNQQINTLIVKHGFDVNYVYYVILNNIEKLKQVAPQTTIPILNKSDFSEFCFGFHEHMYQIKITEVLQAIDRTIAHTEALIEKYQQIKAGLMHDLFTRGIGSDGKLRPPREQAPELYQESAIGWIPREWEVKLLGKLCNITSGGTPNRSKSNFWGGSIPWIKTGEIKYGKIEKSEEHITKEGLNSSSAKLFCKGTVVMAIYGEGNTRGRVAILGIDCASNQACVGFEFNGLIESQFMYFLFEYKYHDLRDMSNDGSQKNLSSSLLKSMDISFPRCKDEQVRITNCLLSINKKIEQEKETRSKLNKQKSGLMHDLLTGKVTVTVEPDENRA